MAQKLDYAFPVTLTNSGGNAHTLSVTLAREAVETAEMIVLHYSLKYNPDTEKDLPPNSPGVMRAYNIEEHTRGRRTRRNFRFELAQLEAAQYQTNPRNLEAFWKPAYRALLLEIIDKMDMCDVLEESPIWVFDDARDEVPLDASVSMPRGGGKTVYPDLSIVMRIPIATLNHNIRMKRFLPLLAELKRAISRSLTIHGSPDPTKPKAMQQIIASFQVAQKQIELAAYLHLQKVRDQPRIVLAVGVGPWLRLLFIERVQVMAALGSLSTSEEAVANHINEQLEGEDEADRDYDERPIENEPSEIPDPGFKDSELSQLSFLSGWTKPVMLGTPPAAQRLDEVHDFVRKFLCDPQIYM